ncbi:MAG: hypothetical protein IT289_08935 [Oligoflexia bacterium]|nr:hypothetical protein [Oligoflexia bacterium]
MKALKDTLLKSLCLPLSWTLLLALEVFYVAEIRNKGVLSKLFEDLVIITSFLFYSPNWAMNPANRTYWSWAFMFAGQFAFWWVVGIALFWVLGRLKKSHGEAAN